MSISGPGQNPVGGGEAHSYSLDSLEASKLKKKAPLIDVFKKFDLNNDRNISRDEAMMLLANYNTDDKAKLSHKEFGQLEKQVGDMGRGERNLFNNDFLKAVFGSEDVTITADGNKKTFRDKDGNFLGTVEQDGDKFTFLNEAGKKTKAITMSGNNLTTETYDDTEKLTEKKEIIKGSGTKTTTYEDDGTRTVTYEGDNLIAQNNGVVKEKLYTKDGMTFKVTTDADGKENTFFANSASEKVWIPLVKINLDEAKPKQEPEQQPEPAKPKLNEAFENFANKVTIDEEGSHQRLNGAKQWETDVRIPKKATVNDNGSPSEIQIKLPSSYGNNAFQTLRLVDAENNIYQDRAGNRKFRVDVTDDGITLKHIEIDDAKTKAFLDANEPSYNGGELKGVTVVGKKGSRTKIAAGKDSEVQNTPEAEKPGQVRQPDKPQETPAPNAIRLKGADPNTGKLNGKNFVPVAGKGLVKYNEQLKGYELYSGTYDGKYYENGKVKTLATKQLVKYEEKDGRKVPDDYYRNYNTYHYGNGSLTPSNPDPTYDSNVQIKIGGRTFEMSGGGYSHTDFQDFLEDFVDANTGVIRAKRYESGTYYLISGNTKLPIKIDKETKALMVTIGNKQYDMNYLISNKIAIK